MTKVVLKENGVPIAEVSFDLRLFENMKRLDVLRKMAVGNVSLEVGEAAKVEFNEATLFACGILQLLKNENVKCESPNTSATPG